MERVTWVALRKVMTIQGQDKAGRPELTSSHRHTKITTIYRITIYGVIRRLAEKISHK